MGTFMYIVWLCKVILANKCLIGRQFLHCNENGALPCVLLTWFSFVLNTANVDFTYHLKRVNVAYDKINKNMYAVMGRKAHVYATSSVSQCPFYYVLHLSLTWICPRVRWPDICHCFMQWNSYLRSSLDSSVACWVQVTIECARLMLTIQSTWTVGTLPAVSWRDSRLSASTSTIVVRLRKSVSLHAVMLRIKTILRMQQSCICSVWLCRIMNVDTSVYVSC